jgi:valyl-tRNA synthetase
MKRHRVATTSRASVPKPIEQKGKPSNDGQRKISKGVQSVENRIMNIEYLKDAPAQVIEKREQENKRNCKRDTPHI